VDVGWSLAIEEHFYLVWPLVIWLCPPRLVAWLCTAIFVSEVFARSFARASDVAVLPIYVVTWFRLDGLVVGALLAVARRRGIMTALDRLVPAVVIAGVAGLIAVTILGGHTWWWNRRMQQFGYSLIAVVAGAMLVGAINRPADSLWPRMLSAGWLRAFGKYSYCLYLIHLPVMRAVREYVFNPSDYETLAIAPWIGQVLFYPVTDAGMDTASYQEFADGPWLTKPAMAWFWDAYAPNVDDRDQPLASPLRSSLDGLRGLPPALVVVDDNDVLRDEGEAYARRLLQADVEVTAARIIGAIHDFAMLNALAGTEAARSAIRMAADKLKAALQ